MEAEAEVVEQLELSFSDLLLLSSAASALSLVSSSPRELVKLESFSSAVMQAGGPSGRRPLVGHGVPKTPHWNRKLALLDKKDADRVRKPPQHYWNFYRWQQRLNASYLLQPVQQPWLHLLLQPLPLLQPLHASCDQSQPLAVHL